MHGAVFADETRAEEVQDTARLQKPNAAAIGEEARLLIGDLDVMALAYCANRESNITVL